MRIVTYHPRARVGDGGITNSVRRLNAAWARLGIDAAIAFDGHGASGRDDAGVDWLPVRHGGPRGARGALELRSALAGADLLILNSAWSVPNVVAAGVARRVGVPYVLAPRGAYDPRIVARRRVLKRIWWRLFERPVVRSAAAVHVFFHEQRSNLTELGYGGPVIVAPNGVEVPAQPRWTGSDGYVLFLGRFDPEHKGLDLLLQAVASLPVPRRPMLRLHGPDWRGGKERVRDLVGRLGLDRVVSLGEPVYGEEKWQLMVRAAGLVYPSRWEGFGNSLAEAAALGVPTLATPYPLARYLGDRGGCIVVDATEPALAEGLERLRSPAAADIGRTAEGIVTRDLTWDAVGRRWLEQLEQLDRFGR